MRNYLTLVNGFLGMILLSTLLGGIPIALPGLSKTVRAESLCISEGEDHRQSPFSDEIMTWLRDKQWETNKAFTKPSESLLQHINTSKDPIAEPLSWLVEAKRLYKDSQFTEAADLLLGALALDRTLLSFQREHINALCFPLICALLDNKETDRCQRLLSACALASGTPISYLRSFVQRLPERALNTLWPDHEPFVVLRDFSVSSEIFTLADRQDRESLITDFDENQCFLSKGALALRLSESKRDDLLVLGWPEMFMALEPGEAGLRCWTQTKSPQSLEFVVQVSGTLWDDEPFQWLLRVPNPIAVQKEWVCFDTASIRKDLMGALFFQYGWNRSFTMHFAEPEALERAQLRIAGIGFDIPPGPANQFYFDRIELYLPRDSWLRETQPPKASEYGRFWLAPVPNGARPTENNEDLENLEALRSMGYLGAVTASHAYNGVQSYDPQQAWEGVNFLVSGHGPELLLMDMKGNPLHLWQCNFDHPLWPKEVLPADFMRSSFWRRALLYPNGDVVAVLDYIVLAKMDKDGNFIWVKPGPYHHKIDIAENGDIYTLYAEKKVHPESEFGDEPLVDYIMVLNTDGEELWRLSLIEALENSYYAPVLHSLNFKHDVLHTNSIQILDGTLAEQLPAFKKGNILVCMHQPSFIAVIDPALKSVVWGQSGMWLYPHEPVLAADGTMMIFDNHGPQWNYMNRLASRVIEFDPLTRNVLWDYTGTREHPFLSYFCGSVASLPNGNVLISETSGGRAFEVTRKKEIVWEYFNTHRAEDNEDLIAVVFEVIRYPESYVSEWLQRDNGEKQNK